MKRMQWCRKGRQGLDSLLWRSVFSMVDGMCVSRLPAPRGLSLGYYNLTVRAEGLVGGVVGTVRVIVAPQAVLCSAVARGKPTAVGTGFAALFVVLRS